MPFAGGLDALPNGTLLFSIVAAVTYLLIVTWPPSSRRTAAKTLSTALLALLAFLVGGPQLLILALALSSLGDAFLAHDGNKAFLGGLASFLAAHLVYVALFWLDGDGFSLMLGDPWRWLPALLLIAIARFMLKRLLGTVAMELRVPVALYIAAILAMGLTALMLDRPLVMAGAAMFIASDTFLAMEKFLLADSSPHRQWTPYAVWSLYYTGQAAIALGFLL